MNGLLWLQLTIRRFLPLWIVLCAVVAAVFPAAFTFLERFPSYGLAFVIFCMGLTLQKEHFLQLLRQPKVLFWGLGIKWAVNLSIALLFSLLFLSVSEELAAGILLSGVVPSGTAANVYTFMAQGSVALSLAMTTLDTFLSPVVTPGLVKMVFGQFVPVPFLELFWRLVLIVLLPLALGMYIRAKAAAVAERVSAYVSLMSSLTLLLIVLGVISAAQPMLVEQARWLPLLGAVLFLQVLIPFVAGYSIAKKMGFFEEDSRAILFQTGICNTALASILAMESISPLAAVPPVLNMVYNLSLGAWIANYFIKKGFLKRKDVPCSDQVNEN